MILNLSKFCREFVIRFRYVNARFILNYFLTFLILSYFIQFHWRIFEEILKIFFNLPTLLFLAILAHSALDFTLHQFPSLNFHFKCCQENFSVGSFACIGHIYFCTASLHWGKDNNRKNCICL